MNATGQHLADKQLLYPALQAIARAPLAELGRRFADLAHDAAVWHLPHPLNEIAGRDAVLERYWRPLRRALPDLERRDDIFIAGRFNDADWVAATGHYVGTFTADWLGIRATGGLVFLRFGELYQMVEGKVAGFHGFVDLVDLARQAGIALLRPSAGVDLTVPGPSTRDGVLLASHDQAAGETSRKLVEAMGAGLRSYDGKSLASMEMHRYWTTDFHWYGPCGIGSTRGLKGFEDFHQRPFLHAFPDRRGGHHVARIGDGAYVASLGWPSVKATHKGDYLGVPATGKPIGMRVMDLWRREGDRLAENWIFIDLPELLLQMGEDVFAKLPGAR